MNCVSQPRYELCFPVTIEGGDYVLRIEYDETPIDPRIEEDNMATMVCWHNRYNLGDEHNYNSPNEFMLDMFQNLCKPSDEEYDEFEKLDMGEKMIKLDSTKLICIQPLNLYDHSEITISTSAGYPYNDRWDSMCVGFIYLTKEKTMAETSGYACDENGNLIKKEHVHDNGVSTWGYKTIPLTDGTWEKRAEEIISNEVKIYDQYLRGYVYGFILEENIHYRDEKKCPHCGEIISIDEGDELKEIDSCWGFYGDCLEDNGILDNIQSGHIS